MAASRHRLAATAFVLALAPAHARAQTLKLVSMNSFDVQGHRQSMNVSITRDRRFVAFASDCQNIAGNDTNDATDVFVRDLRTGATDCASLNPGGAVGDSYSGYASIPRLSDDGQYVTFASEASDLVPGTILHSHIYVRDRWNATTELVDVDSNGVEGDIGCQATAEISADGRFIAFCDYATNLVPGDTNGTFDVFVRDRVAGTTERVSVDSAGAEADGASYGASLSADGRFVAFDSTASNLVANDQNGTGDVFVHDRATGITERVSVDSSGAEGDDGSGWFSLSTDGRIVAFVSAATNLVAHDTNGKDDVFVHDRSTGATHLVSITSTGTLPNDHCFGPAISGDGNVVAFHSDATNLVPNDTNVRGDVFFRDRAAKTTTLASADPAGTQSNGHSGGAAVDEHGRCIAFVSLGSNLVASDLNVGKASCFVLDRGIASWSNYGAGFAGTNGIPSFTARSNPVLGTTVTLDLENSWGSPTTGLLLAGVARASISTNRGGDLLVDVLVTAPIALGTGALAIDWDVPSDPALDGASIDAQALELDPGAAKGVSFTAGLELVPGS
jgi:Tol biopolymer transport system component